MAQLCLSKAINPGEKDVNGNFIFFGVNNSDAKVLQAQSRSMEARIVHGAGFA